MRLALSSSAAVGATPGELVAACMRRGLSGIEIVHDADAAAPACEFAAEVRSTGMDVVGIVRALLPREEVSRAAREGARANAPVIVPVAGFNRALLGFAAEAFSDAGATLLLSHGGDPELGSAIVRLLEPIPGAAAIGLAWELRPGLDDPRFTNYVLDSAGERLAYIRLFGGGPEAHAQTGTGIGAAMGRLALARYSGPLVLVPSSSAYHYAWSAWLGRAGGWGCGSKHSDDRLVTLNTSTGDAG